MTTYWISNLCVLVKSYNIIPFGNDINENFNALARLIIFVTIVSILTFNETESDNILLLGASALILSVIIYFLVNRMYVNFSRDNYKTVEIKPPIFNNNKGLDTYDNLSATKKVTGLKDKDYTAFSKIQHTKF